MNQEERQETISIIEKRNLLNKVINELRKEKKRKYEEGIDEEKTLIGWTFEEQCAIDKCITDIQKIKRELYK